MRNYLFIIFFTLLFIVLCSPSPVPIAGGGTTVIIVDGKCIDSLNNPIDSAKITIYRKDNNIFTIFDSTLTKKGYFKFSLTKQFLGTFNFEAVKIQGVDTILKGTTNNIQIDSIFKDTIKIKVTFLSGIHGYVSFYNENNTFEGASCDIYGTSFKATSNSNGEFLMSDVYPGMYTLTVGKPNFKPLKMDSIVVKANDTTFLKDTFKLEYDEALVPPPPKLLNIDFDSVSRKITLLYKPFPVSDYKKTIFYRKVFDLDSGPIALDTIPKTDLFFVNIIDSSFDLKVSTLQYTAKALDTSNDISIVFSNALTISISPTMFLPAPKLLIATYDTIIGKILLRFNAVKPNYKPQYIIYRWIYNDSTFFTINDTNFTDTIFKLLSDTTPMKTISYAIKTKSKYDSLSKEFSQKLIVNTINPIKIYSISTPIRPIGDTVIKPKTQYLFSSDSAKSNIPYDNIEYRFIVFDSLGTKIFSTTYEKSPSGVLSIDSVGKFIISAQARSGINNNVVSSLSKAVTVRVIINQTHFIPKPVFIIGDTSVGTSIGHIYTIKPADTLCSQGHKILYRIIFPNITSFDFFRSKTVVFSTPGISYVQAEVRCSIDSDISLVSDSLKVTVNK